MDYEEKYKQALERAKELAVQPTIWFGDVIVQKIFPELAESEDEKIRKEIIQYLQRTNAGYCNADYNYKAWISWLEKQKSIEWSEEDEEIRKEISCLIEWSKSYSAAAVTKEEGDKWIEWLKSLKPQNRWKPSDEQMRGLSCAINYFETNNSELVSLYNDLKRLR